LHRPFLATIGRCAAGEGDNVCLLLTGQHARPTGADDLVQGTIESVLGEAFADAPDGARARMQRSGDRVIARAFVGVEQNLGPIDHASAGRAAMDECVQVLAFLVGQFHDVDLLAHGFPPEYGKSAASSLIFTTAVAED
jgi:hypothetical protein